MTKSKNDDDHQGALWDTFGGPFPNIFENHQQQGVSNKKFYVAISITFVTLILLFYLLFKVSPSIINVLRGIPTIITAPAATIIVLATSISLFVLREKRRVIYGLVELTFALVTTWQSVNAAINGDGNWFIVVAAMYVIVRGIDNVKIGIESFFPLSLDDHE